jgi:hypothetical protein
MQRARCTASPRAGPVAGVVLSRVSKMVVLDDDDTDDTDDADIHPYLVVLWLMMRWRWMMWMCQYDCHPRKMMMMMMMMIRHAPLVACNQ